MDVDKNLSHSILIEILQPQLNTTNIFSKHRREIAITYTQSHLLFAAFEYATCVSTLYLSILPLHSRPHYEEFNIEIRIRYRIPIVL